MREFLVVQYTIKHHNYVPVSSCTLHDKISEICVRIQLYSTQRNSSNMCLYLGAQYIEKHQKYVPLSSYTVHDNASEICASIQLYSTEKENYFIVKNIIYSAPSVYRTPFYRQLRLSPKCLTVPISPIKNTPL